MNIENFHDTSSDSMESLGLEDYFLDDDWNYEEDDYLLFFYIFIKKI